VAGGTSAGASILKAGAIASGVERAGGAGGTTGSEEPAFGGIVGEAIVYFLGNVLEERGEARCRIDQRLGVLRRENVRGGECFIVLLVCHLDNTRRERFGTTLTLKP
jgi:hypothetical protein